MHGIVRVGLVVVVSKTVCKGFVLVCEAIVNVVLQSTGVVQMISDVEIYLRTSQKVLCVVLGYLYIIYSSATHVNKVFIIVRPNVAMQKTILVMKLVVFVGFAPQLQKG